MSRDGFSPVTVNKTQFFLDDDLAILLPPPTIQLVQAAPAQRSAESSPSLKPTIPTSPEYTENDFAANCENQYYRYIPNSEKISHLLLKRESNEAYQFSIPHPTGVPEVPAIEPLTESIYGYTLPNENHAFQGRTASGEIMISRRHYNLSIQNGNDDPIEYTFFPLSPKKNLAGFYGPTFVNRFVETEAAKSAVKKILESDAITGSKQSGELEIVNKDIPIRAEIKTRKPDQNTVMGKKSAAVAYGEFLEKYKPILTEDLQKILHDSSTTPWDSSNLTLQKRPEWLHRHGFRLHPMHIDPQTVNNLGAGRKCHNTAMMIPERTVERLIKKYPEAKAKICCNFTTLLDSDIINTIYFYVAIEVEKFKIRITQKIDAFEKNPQFVKASDMASIVGILCMMIQNIAPLSIRRVSVLSNMPAIARFPSALFSNNSLSAVNRKREREEIVVKKELPEEKDDAALNNSEIALLLASL